MLMKSQNINISVLWKLCMIIHEYFPATPTKKNYIKVNEFYDELYKSFMNLKGKMCVLLIWKKTSCSKKSNYSMYGERRMFDIINTFDMKLVKP